MFKTVVPREKKSRIVEAATRYPLWRGPTAKLQASRTIPHDFSSSSLSSCCSPAFESRLNASKREHVFFFFHVSFPIWKFWMTIIVSSFVFLFIYQFTVSSFFSFVNIKFEVRLCVSFPSILLWYCYCRQNFGQLSFLRSFLYSFINLQFQVSSRSWI